MRRLQTISDSYLSLQQNLHDNPEYGIASLSFAPIVADIIREGKIKTVCDFGAGKQNLLNLDSAVALYCDR